MLLLDEATAALDNQTSYAVIDAVLSMKEMTEIIVTHRLEEKLLYQYDEIFGYACRRKLSKKGTFEGSLEVQRQLIADYKEDIRKYAEGMDQTEFLNVFNHIPVQLAKDNKKFQISKVASGARFRDYRGCIEWLHDAGMVNVAIV